jgi:hypothetical protein
VASSKGNYQPSRLSNMIGQERHNLQRQVPHTFQRPCNLELRLHHNCMCTVRTPLHYLVHHSRYTHSPSVGGETEDSVCGTTKTTTPTAPSIAATRRATFNLPAIVSLLHPAYSTLVRYANRSLLQTSTAHPPHLQATHLPPRHRPSDRDPQTSAMKTSLIPDRSQPRFNPRREVTTAE